MNRKQWFASGIIACMFLYWCYVLYVQVGGDFNRYVDNHWKGDNKDLGYLIQVAFTDILLFNVYAFFGLAVMIALICFICGVLEKKKEKK